MSDFTNSDDPGTNFGHGDTSELLPPQGAASTGASLSPGLISSSSAPAGGRASQVWVESSDQEQQPVAAPAEPTATPTVELTAAERRVLGALIEKSYLTPDVYPMTTNGLVTACNQKTNRDPVVDYSAVLIDSTLMELRQRNLVRRVHSAGSRSTKHRQTLDEALSLSERQLALMSVLLLRGPQTIGELRLRTERHDVGFDDLDAVQACLNALSSRANPLVEQLERQPGHKENRWQHLLADVDSQDHTEYQAPANEPARASVPSSPALSSPAPTRTSDDGALASRVSELEAQVTRLQRQLGLLAEKLGEPLE